MSNAENNTVRLRTYGVVPFRVAVLHGGPGALGSMAAVARTLSAQWGVLEPLLAALSIDGQVEDLRTLLDRHATAPVSLIGSSWGAMLGFIFAARYPDLVSKLILVGSGPYEARYAVGIDHIRSNRLSDEDRRREMVLVAALNDPAVEDKDGIFAQLGRLSAQTDTYDPIGLKAVETDLEVHFDVFAGVWPEASALRANGQLLALGEQIHCPVVAIHGDYDPHPSEGIREPLSRVLPDFRFILLQRCGHEPWIERHARDEFYRLLRTELRTVGTT
jgi:pimeloyl-ACP methyl ester carboxylesterase